MISHLALIKSGTCTSTDSSLVSHGYNVISTLIPPAGLDRLKEAEQAVNQLSKDLAVKEQELEVASHKADVVLQEVAIKAQAAEMVKTQVQKVKDKAQAIVDEIAGDKKAAESKLEAAKPALAASEAALQVRVQISLVLYPSYIL